jgi:hypothetical protein
MSFATTTKVIGSLELREAIQELLDEATAKEQSDRRSEVRYPFFCPISISTGGQATRKFSGFTREISLSGAGLLVNMPLERQEVLLSIHRETAAPMHLRTKIVWCRPCGEGWYLAGGRFVDAIPGCGL